jgi:hypothetical protein
MVAARPSSCRRPRRRTLITPVPVIFVPRERIVTAPTGRSLSASRSLMVRSCFHALGGAS